MSTTRGVIALLLESPSARIKHQTPTVHASQIESPDLRYCSPILYPQSPLLSRRNMPRKSPPPRLPPLDPIRPLSPVSPLGTTYRTSPVSPLTPSPPLFRPVQFRSSETTPILKATHHAQPESRVPTPTPAPVPDPAPTEPEAENLPIPPVRPERPQSQICHSSVNALPQRPEWSDPALEAQIARKDNERKAQRELYILMALVLVLGMIFLIVWLSVSHAGQ
ncbi:hypothetical protein JMJ35_010474 [Cladonia borealis]|uniref:Uncharacterized protein n=1 Tax=Cladonia borealis TaxID=184061 RepID=A0AA39QRD7_9LECA|nr:hypothetical protein JMJ35_010474 [Cladonia borealis]